MTETQLQCNWFFMWWRKTTGLQSHQIIKQQQRLLFHLKQKIMPLCFKLAT